MTRNLSFAEQLKLLFEHGDARGKSSAYRTIAIATSENATYIHRLHRGENLNPGLKLLASLTHYFHMDFDYFECTSRTACRAYLSTIRKHKLTDYIEKQVIGISEGGRAYILKTIDFTRQAEELQPFGE